MHIIVYERHAEKGRAEERPLALFTNPREAMVFLEMVMINGRTAFTRVV